MVSSLTRAMSRLNVKTLVMALLMAGLLVFALYVTGADRVLTGLFRSNPYVISDTSIVDRGIKNALATYPTPPKEVSKFKLPGQERNIPYFITVRFEHGSDLCKLWEKEAPGSKANVWWQFGCLMNDAMDGPKDYICKNMTDMADSKVCMDKPYRPEEKCLVYSFGTNNNFQFDDAMAAQGCEVYSFDPGLGLPEFRHSDRVFFKNVGLGAEDSDSFQPNMDSYVEHMAKWKMRTLKSIMKTLGHEKRTIDFLKIDIEAYEWDVLPNIISDGLLGQVKQLQIQWHIMSNNPPREDYESCYKLFMSLRPLGFQSFYSRSGNRYHHFNYFTTTGDVTYVNTIFNRPNDPSS